MRLCSFQIRLVQLDLDRLLEHIHPDQKQELAAMAQHLTGKPHQRATGDADGLTGLKHRGQFDLIATLQHLLNLFQFPYKPGLILNLNQIRQSVGAINGVGGILVDGKMLLGRDGLAAEAGHMVMIVGDRFSSLEEEAAGPDMAAHARRRIEAGEKSAMVDIVDGDLDKLSGKVVGDAAMQGDALALDIIHWGGTVAGCGIVNLLHLFNPDVIVIGGGVTAVGNLIFDPINEAIKKYSIDDAYWEELIVAPAALRDDVSIYGAGALVLTEGGTLDIAEVSKLIGADS